MYARLLAPVCLLTVGAVAATSQSMSEGSNEIGVYLRQTTGASTVVLEAMQRETEALMDSGSFHLQWLHEPHEVAAASLVVVHLEGSCNPWPAAVIQPAVQRLASTSVANGRILPFINLDCAALRQFLARALRGTLKPSPQFLYGRALGRLLAHELYHVVGKTRDHTSAGVTRAAVSVSDLISDQFKFGKAALSKLHGPLASTKAEGGIGADMDLR
jgi:hypothetical protein